MEKTSLGLVSISFRQHSPEELLKEVKRIGLTCIEWGSDVHAPKDDRARLLEIQRLQESYGITCCSYGTYFKLGVHPMEELEGYIDAAKILGTNILRLWCGDKNSEDYTKEEKEELFEICRQAAAIAEKHQVIFCMECHNNTFTIRKESALELMQAVNSPHFQMYYQPNQFVSAEENIAYARLLADYTKHLHVFNWNMHTRYPLKEAVEIWKTYLEQFEGEHCLLMEFVPDDKLETLEVEVQALREIVGR